MTTSNSANEVQLESGWKARLLSEFTKPYMLSLKAFLQAELKAGKSIYPRPSEYFAALNRTPFEKVKVVILGQDPYHGPGQAHGLAFSVRPGVRIPPSLLNIYKELKTDIIGFERPLHGYLSSWSDQGVLLLNSVLTVEKDLAGSHQKKGWEVFTDKAIEALSSERENLVFILWGAYAQKKGAVIDRKKHLVLEGPHPSPLSASRGFFGSRPFSQANAYLREHHLPEVMWQVPVNLERELQ
jgi:uracil-DNA glycosylase